MKTVRNIVLGSFAGVILIGFLLTATYVFWVTRDLPSYDALAHYEPPITTRVYAGNGTLNVIAGGQVSDVSGYVGLNTDCWPSVEIRVTPTATWLPSKRANP
jgi:hypothetical protein